MELLPIGDSRTECRADVQPQRIRDSSVTVGPEWELLEEIDFSRLNQLNFNVEEPEDLYVWHLYLLLLNAFCLFPDISPDGAMSH